jgi:hypothetical protein
MNRDANRALLDSVNQARLWFRAWKIEPIWVKPIQPDRPVDTIEGNVTSLKGDVLCRGSAGDTWPQRMEYVLEKYQPMGIADGEGWAMYEPRPEHGGVLAAQIDHPFCVETERGCLDGKAGDYLVKEHADQNDAYPDRLWVVDRQVFADTYRFEEH